MAALIGKNMIHPNTTAGFSTLEIIIALAVVSLSLAATTQMSLGAQSLVLRSEISLGILADAESVFDQARAGSFYELKNTASTSAHVLDITQCVKKFSVGNVWSTFFTFPEYVGMSGEACGGPELVREEWATPEITTHSLLQNQSDNEITDLDVVDAIAFVSTNSATASEIDLSLFNVDESFVLISSIDVGAGIVAIDTTREYVFAVTDATSSQFVVIDVRNPLRPTVLAKRDLFQVDPYGSFPQGRSVTYLDSRVYVGTRETAGPEFHVFNVSNAANPFEVGAYELTHNVHDIAVREDIAYLATSADTQELIVLDVHTPTAITEIGSFNADGVMINDRDAMSISLLGDTVFLGRRRGNVPQAEWYAVDISEPKNPALRGLFDLNMAGASYVSGSVVSGALAFVSTTDPTHGFFVLDIDSMDYVETVLKMAFTHPLVSLDIQNGVLYGLDAVDRKIYEIKAR